MKTKKIKAWKCGWIQNEPGILFQEYGGYFRTKKAAINHVKTDSKIRNAYIIEVELQLISRQRKVTQ